MTVHVFDEYKADIESVGTFGSKRPPGPPLPPTGGGSDGMEARIARLESDVDHIKLYVSDLKADVRLITSEVTQLRIDSATMTERVGNLPTKKYIVAALGIMLGLIAGLVTFQEQIRHFLGH